MAKWNVPSGFKTIKLESTHTHTTRANASYDLIMCQQHLSNHLVDCFMQCCCRAISTHSYTPWTVHVSANVVRCSTNQNHILQNIFNYHFAIYVLVVFFCSFENGKPCFMWKKNTHTVTVTVKQLVCEIKQKQITCAFTVFAINFLDCWCELFNSRFVIPLNRQP